MNRTALAVIMVASAFLSLFFFPYPATVVLSLFAGIVFPPLPFLIGLLADLLYFVPPASLPLGTLIGAAVSLASFFVRRFIKARIIT